MNAELKSEIEKHFVNHVEAARFLCGYRNLCHQVDDLIDLPQNSTAILDAFNLATDVFSTQFYHSNITWIYPIVKNMHRVYSASVAWEKSDVKWKADYGDVLRCCGNEMTVAFLEHVCHLPYAELRRLDAMMREDAWVTHHDSDGKAI
ncbi:MAG TPA: hypothetical protein VMQ67_09555 [Candidatus Saccharimonadales bacterium]|nr:hypothetical protein [Candidatus Saccharimonadales bacterium]